MRHAETLWKTELIEKTRRTETTAITEASLVIIKPINREVKKTKKTTIFDESKEHTDKENYSE